MSSSPKPHMFLGIPKIPARYATVVMPFFLSVLMSCLVSGISTLNSVGFDSSVFVLWPRAWLVSWLIAFPSLLLVLPFVKKLTAAVVASTPEA